MWMVWMVYRVVPSIYMPTTGALLELEGRIYLVSGCFDCGVCIYFDFGLF